MLGCGDLSVARLEQRYVRADDDVMTLRYDYRAPAFGFEARRVYDEAGVVLDYPGIGPRVLERDPISQRRSRQGAAINAGSGQP